MNLLPLAPLTLLALLPLPSRQDPGKPAASAPARSESEDLKKLAWVSGTWTLTNDGKTTEEHWRPLQGTTILGSSHTYDAQETRFFEHLRITAMRGRIAYIALPGGANGTVFLLSKLEDGLVEFENPKHDHPQRIRYEKTEQGITATTSQLDGSRARKFVFQKKPS